jgi:lipoyl(octanoyl) transferase
MLDVLPTRADSAAANMAADFLLLKRYPGKMRARFRAYGWHRPAFSFGYSQKIAWVRANLPADADNPELVRRPSGGGLVDHRDDWTYALVIPRGHALETARAVDSYRAVHAALAEALRACGQPATLKDRCDPVCSKPQVSDSPNPPSSSAKPTICFTRPELHDVIHPETGRKIAGAAQKRSKEGLLFQGSLLRPAAPRIGYFDTFHAAFVSALAAALDLGSVEVPWPEFPEGEAEALTEQYSAPEWTEAR